MDQGSAIVLAALITLAGVVLVAVVGLGGVWIGGRISAGSARDAAKIAADAAMQAALVSQREARADRDEARSARFADRVRKLSARLLESVDEYVHGYALAMAESYGGREVPPIPPIGTGREGLLELRLLVRLPATSECLVRLTDAIGFERQGLSTFHVAPGVRERDKAWSQWLQAVLDYGEAVEAFEDAIRNELGRPPVVRETGGH